LRIFLKGKEVSVTAVVRANGISRRVESASHTHCTGLLADAGVDGASQVSERKNI
jgi:hypothetical protein